MQLVAAAACWHPLHFLHSYPQTFVQPSSGENLHFWVCQWENVLVRERKVGGQQLFCLVADGASFPPSLECLNSTSTS